MEVSVSALVSNTVFWWCLYTEKRTKTPEHLPRFFFFFTLLVKPVQAWKAEDQGAKEKSHTMDNVCIWEQGQVSSGAGDRSKHWRFNRAWSRLSPGGQRQPLVQMHGCTLHSCGSDTVAMLHSKSVCLCPDTPGWMQEGSGGRETRLAKQGKSHFRTCLNTLLWRDCVQVIYKSVLRQVLSWIGTWRRREAPLQPGSPALP